MFEDAEAMHTGRPRSEPILSMSRDEVVSVLRRRGPVIVLFALLCACIAYGLSLLLPQSFVASTQIFVDPRTIQALDSTQGQNQADGNGEILFVESQSQIVSSQSVLSRVVASQHLDQDPEFNGAASGGPFADFVIRGTHEAVPEHDTATRAAVAALADRLTVRRPERTFVIDIAVRARTAEKAARLANALAQAYFDEQSDAHVMMARRANKALTDRLDELRDRVRQAEQRAQDFRRAHGLIGTRTQLISEQQLTDATTQLAQARSRLVQARSRMNGVRNFGSPGVGDDSPEAVVSSTITLLRGQQAEAKRKLDNATAQFGPLHPAVHDARSEMDGINKAIAAELQRIAQSAKVDLQRATAAEAAQRKIADQLSSEASNATAAIVQLGEYEREIDVDKNLLNTFLSRAGETSELAEVSTSNARVISVAQPPRTRSSPPRGAIFLLLGFVGGLALGTLLALWTAGALARGAVRRHVEHDSSRTSAARSRRTMDRTA